MSWIDTPTIALVCINVIQMLSLLFLLFPIVDIVTLSKKIKYYKEKLGDNLFFTTLSAIYALTIIVYGILGPLMTINSTKTPKIMRKNETPREKIIRVIENTNATRNYLLGGFSMFYLLVGVRLLEYVEFSAKLYEFSDLMGNYDIIDNAFIDSDSEKPVSETTFIIDNTIEEEEAEAKRWPSFVDLNKAETAQIRKFLKEKDDIVSVGTRKKEQNQDSTVDSEYNKDKRTLPIKTEKESEETATANQIYGKVNSGESHTNSTEINDTDQPETAGTSATKNNTHKSVNTDPKPEKSVNTDIENEQNSEDQNLKLDKKSSKVTIKDD